MLWIQTPQCPNCGGGVPVLFLTAALGSSVKANQSPFLILSFSICYISTCTLQRNKHKDGASKKIIGGGLVAKLCLTLVTPWTIARQAPLSVEFSRQEYCSELPFPSPGEIFPTQGLNPGLLHCRQILYWLSYKGSPKLNHNLKLLISNVCVCVFCLYFLCFPSLNFCSFVFNQSKQFANFILISRYEKGSPSFTGTGTDSFQAKQSLGML